MTEPLHDDPHPTETSFLVGAEEGYAPEVEYIVPATAYEAITTEDERVAPAPSVPQAVPHVDPSPSPGAIAELGRKLDAMQVQFDREIRAEATREKVVDRLHAELQEYKSDLLLGVLRPVFVDLIQLHDDIGKMALSADQDATQSRFADIQQGIEDILYRQGVEPFEAGDGVFDARRQRAVSTVATDDPTLVRTVAARHRKGFAAGEKVIRPEIVSVYTLRRPSAAEAARPS